MDMSLQQESARELLLQADDAENSRKQRYSLLLRHPRTLEMQKSFHVWMCELESGQAERKDFSLPVPLKHSELRLQQLQFLSSKG